MMGPCTWDLGGGKFTQADIDFTAFMVSRTRFPKRPRRSLFIPFDEHRRRLYDEETNELLSIIHVRQADERQTA